MTSRHIFNKAAEAGLSTAVLKIFHQVISFGATVLLVRALSQEEFGIYSILYAIIPMLNIVGSFGLQDVIQRFLPEYYIKKEFKLASKLVFRVFIMRSIVSIIVIFAIFVYWDTLSALIKIKEYKTYFAIFCVCIIAYQQWGILTATVEAFFLHKFAFYIQIAVVTMRAAAYLVCLVQGYGLFEIVVIDTVVYLILAAAFFGLYGRVVPKAGGERDEFGPTDRRRIFRYAFFNNFNSIGVRFMDNGTNYLIVAYFMSPTQVAIYAFCNQLANRFARISPVNYLAAVIRPAFFSFGIASEEERIVAMMRFLMKCIIWFYLPIFCFAMLTGEAFIALVFGKFQGHADVFAACIVVAAIGALGFPISMAAQLRERVDIILYSKVFGFLSLVLSVLTVPYYGIWGAICAVGAGQLMKNIFIGWFIRDLLPLADIGRSGARALVYWVVVAAVLTCFPWTIGNLAIVSITAAVFLTATIMFIVLCIDLDMFERRFVQSIATKARLQRYLPKRMGG